MLQPVHQTLWQIAETLQHRAHLESFVHHVAQVTKRNPAEEIPPAQKAFEGWFPHRKVKAPPPKLKKPAPGTKAPVDKPEKPAPPVQGEKQLIKQEVRLETPKLKSEDKKLKSEIYKYKREKSPGETLEEIQDQIKRNMVDDKKIIDEEKKQQRIRRLKLLNLKQQAH